MFLSESYEGLSDMPTLTEVRGESRKKEAGTHVDFSAIWEVPDAGLVQDEVINLPSCVPYQ